MIIRFARSPGTIARTASTARMPSAESWTGIDGAQTASRSRIGISSAK
jgi:hypothetical protein